MVEFGEYIRDARLRRGLTIEELSDKARVSASLISMIENGKRGIPKPTTLRHLAEVLGLELKELFDVVEKSRQVNFHNHESPTEPASDMLQRPVERSDFKYTSVLKDITAGDQLFSPSHIVGQRPILLHDIWADRGFYFEVTDESMRDEGIKKGHRVLIYLTSQYANGDIILAIAPGDKRALLRRIFLHPSSDVAVLQSANPKFPPKIIPMHDFDVLVRYFGMAIQVEYDLVTSSNSTRTTEHRLIETDSSPSES